MWIEISKKVFDELTCWQTDSYLNTNNDSCFKERTHLNGKIKILKETSHLIEGEWRTMYYENSELKVSKEKRHRKKEMLERKAVKLLESIYKQSNF